MPPVNDNFASRILLAGPTFLENGDNTDATVEAGEQDLYDSFYGAGANSVWYEYVPAVSGLLTLDTLQSLGITDSIIWVFTGTAINNLALVGFNDDSNINTLSDLTIYVTAGVSYKIAITGFGDSDEGTFKLNGSLVAASWPVINDAFASSILKTGMSFSISDFNYAATVEAGEPAANHNSIWYHWVAPVSGVLTFFWTGGAGGMGQNVFIYTGNTLASLVLVASGGSLVVTAGVTYRIALCSYQDGVTGDVNLTATLHLAPDNDNFENAIPLVNGTSFDNTYATVQVGEPSTHYHSLWYKYTATDNGLVAITHRSNSGIAAKIYTGSALKKLTEKFSTSVNAYNPFPLLYTTYSFAATKGTTYYIVFYSTFNGGETQTGINIALTPLALPSNDFFTNRKILTGTTFSDSGSNIMATVQLYEDPTHYHSLWYEWTPDNGGQVTISRTSGVNINIFVYVGSTITGLVLVKSGANTVNFGIIGGQNYKIAICSSTNDLGGDFAFNGVYSSLIPIKYVGPTTPTLTFNSSGEKGILYDSSINRIYVISQADGLFSHLRYSDNEGVTWTTDKDFNYTDHFLASLFFDSSGNLLVLFAITLGDNTWHYAASKRDKNTGVWTDYASSDLVFGPAGGTWVSRLSFCQGDDFKIHIAQTYVKSNNPYANSCSNIMYTTFLNGVFSTPTLITQYKKGVFDTDGSAVYFANFGSLNLVNHNGDIIIFWNVSDTVGGVTTKYVKYCTISDPPLIMDAVMAAHPWITATKYFVGELVTQSSVIYQCQTDHTSGVFATDLGAGKWAILSSYATPTTWGIPGGSFIATVRSNGKLYAITSPTADSSFMQDGLLYEDFVNITPPVISGSSGGYSPFHVELAENGDLVLYGEKDIGNSGGFILPRISDAWLDIYAPASGNPSNLHSDFCGGNTYNFAKIL